MTSIEIEDIYPLSPAQQGLLFHSLYAPGAGTYFTQFVCTLQGEVDVAALERAWQEVAARHPALRASFVWEDVQEPLQVVHHRELRIPFALHDLAEMPTDELDGWIDNFLREDRNRGFNLSKAPLMRLTLLRTQDAAYQLIWSHHHLLLDGWSVSLILGEVFAFYAAILNGQEPPPAQPRPHRDYIEWLQRQDLSKAETFWRQELHGFSMPTPLVVGPAQNGHAPVEHDYAEQHILLSAEETASLQSLARQHGLTMTTIMQGAWALLLSRYSGLEDVLFGTVASGRSVDLPEIESIAGMLINTLPLRVRTPSSMHALPWLKALQERQTEARRYEYTPLARAHEWSMVPRDLSLFESVLTFENYPAPVWLRQGGNGGLGLSDIRMLEQSHYPLVVQAIPIPELLVKVVYDSSRFEAASIIRMLGHLQTLLAGIAADPMLPLGDYSLLTATEREQLLVEWNYNGDEPVAPVCLHRQFELQVEKSPQAVAMLFEGEQFTYAELNRRANRVAHRLQELGVEPDVPVGLYVERSPEMVIGLLGILKAGGAYVPLDPAYPRERLAFMLEDARVPILLAQRHLVERLPQHTAQVICLDDGWAAGGQANDSNLTCEVAPDNLAYIIYTSGSTGTPKGALVTHANVARLFTATRRWFNFGPGDVWTLFHSYTFDFSVWELWGALLYGGRLVVVPDRVRRSPETFYNLLCDEGVTVLNQTPSAFRQLMWAEEASRVRADLALRLVIFGGEALEVGSLQPWFERHGDTSPQLANMYGITETTVHVTYHPLTRADTRHGPGSVIGRPIPDLQTYVLDMRMQPVPVGVPGEIYVGGAGLARGYLRRPELTAERFVPNPFVSTEYRVPSAEGRGASAFHTPHSGGERLYKTGDLARYLPGGELEYLGRSDRQVKIRGFRIELGELEAALSRHPAVRQAVAIAREDVPGEKQLVAYIVAEQDSLSISDLRRFLQAHLPDYMVPAAFVTLDALPITHNGKIDYRALPPPEQSRPDIQSGYTAPRTPEEKLLAEIWGQVLRVEGVGVDDNFFELGGDSILSIQIVARANQEGLKLTPRQLFERPTIAQLAQVVSNSPAAHAQDEQVEGPVRFTPIQLRFFGQDLPQPQHYNQAVFLEVLQELDPALLEKAIRYLPVHHDALRLRFSQEASGWQQFCAGWDAAISSASFVQFDLSGLPHDVQGAAIEQKGLELHRSLDLANGPLMAAAHFNLGPGKPARLLIVVHHLAVDAVSWPILLVDLQSAYEQLSRGESIRLPSKTTSFQEWAERLVAHARSGAVEQELDYWLARRGTQVAPLPLDYPDGLAANNELSAQEVTVAFDDDETSTLLHDIARDYRAQVNEVLLAALAQVIARWAGGEQALIDLEGHGREDLFDDVDLSRTVGWFTTIFPALIPAREGADPRRALNMVKEYLRGIPNRGIGYGLLRYLSANPAISAELGSLPQAQVSFNYLGRLDNGLADSTMFDWAHGSTGPIHSP
ncbi:MAG TPA: amino acid adenylation domain-containing protein, partial [Chloroflexia bacterium]|nr:amino acid adenylation domain-containing protein [Chloroflexia bacterium]